ncbi:hypothetical protein MMC09_005815 [Bachmanniomyces sp. S44760]|nr:hypothetical protein [Bachmanniomyces sp. S44760]
MADSISIEETNKIRIAVGLKPLLVPGGFGPALKRSEDDEDGSSSSEEEDLGSTLESRQAQGYENWKKVQVEADAKKAREAKNEAIKKARDAARKFSKLEGKGLGEADDVTELDTKSWLVQQKKRQKKLDRERLMRLERELKEREDIAPHTAEDLAGVRVGHELGDFEDGEQVLTLKDTTIDENEDEGDELENLDMQERERLSEKLELKKKKPLYNPNDMDDSSEKVLLKQYDETIDGKKRKRFTLDGKGTTSDERVAMQEKVGERLRAQPLSLEASRDAPMTDYIESSAVKVKKLKNKKAKSTRHRVVDEDDMFPEQVTFAGEAIGKDVMDVDSGSQTVPFEPAQNLTEDKTFVDDDELQSALAKQRREALKRRKKTKPADIARQMREETSAIPGPEQDDDEAQEGGLIIDETSEFVANLQKPAEPERRRKATSTQGSKDTNGEHTTFAYDVDDGDIDMNEAFYDKITNDEHDVYNAEDSKVHVKRETSIPNEHGVSRTGLEEESTLNQGIGATLNLLSQRGLIKNAAESGDLNVIHRERQKFLAEKQKREAEAERKARVQRERDRASGKLDRMSAREREEYARWENKQRDQQESRQMAEVFSREYKPDVQLKYVDEFGRSMNQKEAFKHLSHQFHGKGSGKLKTEKHLKRIEDDKKQEAISSLDSSQTTGMNNAVGATAKKTKQPGVRLA